MREIAKSKTAAKSITFDGPNLRKIVLDTMKKASDMVGSTLGPNGKVVLIERQENLAPYVSKDGISVFKAMAFEDPTMQTILESARDSSARTNTEAGDGPQPLWSNILTPNGFVKMAYAKVGMDICGTNGSIQKILGVYLKGIKEIYEVEIENKGIVECCADHLWTVTDFSDRQVTKSVAELIKDYAYLQNDGSIKYKYFIPKTHAEFNENKSEMPLDPYLVGVLLGDGSLRDSGSIEISLGIRKKHIIDKLKIPNGINMSIQFVEHKNYYRVKFSGVDNNNKSMRDHIRSLGLSDVNSFSKFIPKSYLYASKEAREKLLQGIIDTDGHINIRNKFEISSVSNKLINDIKELAISLGKSVGITTKIRTKENGAYSDSIIYCLYELKGYKNGDKIVRISPTGKFTEMQCIKVSNPDNLYITDNYVVTHNTTTATILAEAIIRKGHEYLLQNPKLSTQKIVREIEKCYKDIVEPFIAENSLRLEITGFKDEKEYKKKQKEVNDIIKKVATIATNSDIDMATAVLEGFNIVGYGGNMTILEVPGSSGYTVEKVEGFHIARGFEDSCGRFLEEFINDKGNYRTVLDKPAFILYNGQINNIDVLMPILNKVGDASDPTRPGVTKENIFTPNVVIIAHHFSENVLATLAANFRSPTSINVVPLKTVMTEQANSPYHLLLDLSAFTGATVFDPLTTPLMTAELEDLGINTMHHFEFYRYKSMIIGDPDEIRIFSRVEELEQQAANAESSVDAELIKERIGLLTGGIARIKIHGSSEAELKEKRHRVEDAVMAIKSAIKYGVLPGCGKTLITLSKKIMESDVSDAVKQILGIAFITPFARIFLNGGNSDQEIDDIYKTIMFNKDGKLNDFYHTYDALNHKYGDAIKIGVVDSTGAVLMAIKNSISVAKMLMGLSGIIVFKRNYDLETQEARDYNREQLNMKNALDSQAREEWVPENY